ncbi:MAG: hypothetical protein NTZ51_03065, partial [Proteobacteria bacterium]|nr:hypothetical protein [Pseudomonadota bacterium]
RLRRFPHPSSLRRTLKYAALGITLETFFCCFSAEGTAAVTAAGLSGSGGMRACFCPGPYKRQERHIVPAGHTTGTVLRLFYQVLLSKLLLKNPVPACKNG